MERRRSETRDIETAGMMEVHALTILIAQFVAMSNPMNTHINDLSLGKQLTQVTVIQQPHTWC